MIPNVKYITDKPQGVDKFDGGSQDSLSKAIVQHIIRNDEKSNKTSLPRIIGIEGTWGSGKSNVVKMVEKELSKSNPKQYYFFEYDAWGNQEDLQRRSLLEQLTTELVEKKILAGKTKITIKGGGTKTVSWQEKLKMLLARKTETTSETYPRLSNGMIAAGLTTILTSISSLIGLLLAESCGWCSLIIAFAPIIMTFVVWCVAACRNENYRNISYLLAIYSDKINKETSFELISEDEPSVVEFKKWMNDVSDNLNNQVCQKLVIVFDNMDRLPAEKVKQLWSSIHTFFAETGFDNIWVLIPYDETHLSCAFGEGDDNERLKLTRYFINKTFPVTFSVPKPVITDYKGIFSKLFTEAFGKDNRQEDLINRLYRLNHKEPNVRDIIIFINNLVSLFFVWGEKISLTNMAVFLLHRDEIQQRPIDAILSCDYLKNEKNIIEETELFKSEIAALTYGINMEVAKQIPLTEYINRCIDHVEGYDINQYSDDPNFDAILKEVILSVDPAKNENLVRSLNQLTKENGEVQSVWEEVGVRLLREPISEQVLPDLYKIAIPHLSEITAQKVLNKLCKAWRVTKNFSGAKYVQCIDSLESLIKGKELSIPKPQVQVSPQAYIDAVATSLSEYNKYNLSTDPDSVDSYVAEQVSNENSCSDAVCKLYNDDFSKFENTNAKISEIIRGSAIESNNLWPICKIYRTINKNVVPELIEETVLQHLMTELKDNGKVQLEDGYIDLLAISLARHRDITIEEQHVSQVAQIIDSYANYGELMTKNLSQNISAINVVIKHMIENNLGVILDLDLVVPKIVQIRDHYGVTGSDLIANLSKWSNGYEISEDVENIQTILPNAEIYKMTSGSGERLARIINEFAVEALSKQTVHNFIDTENSFSSNYWHLMLSALLNDETLENKPQCVADYAAYLYKRFATGAKAIQDGYFKSLVDSVNPEQISHVFSEIRDLFCNGKCTISANFFVFCEENFVHYGSLLDRATDVVDKIIKPIIHEERVKVIIINRMDYYSRLFKSAGPIVDFKEKVKQHWSNDPNLLKMLEIKIEQKEQES